MTGVTAEERIQSLWSLHPIRQQQHTHIEPGEIHMTKLIALVAAALVFTPVAYAAAMQAAQIVG